MPRIHFTLLTAGKGFRQFPTKGSVGSIKRDRTAFSPTHEPDGRRTLSVQADITGSTLRLILRLDSLHLGAQQVGARTYAFSYFRSSSSPMATPEIVPSNSPVIVKSSGVPEALNNTTFTIAVDVRAPDAPLKRPVPPVI